MNIAIFGAAGVTGTLLTERCLAAGHTVAALLRRPKTFRLHEKVRVVRGSAFDPSPVYETIEDADVVLSTLGPRSPLRNENVLPRALPRIVEAMQETASQSNQSKPVRRIIVLGSAGALPDSLDKQPAWRRWIVEKVVYKTFLKWPVAEQVAQYAILSRSELDWTMVMPPMLTNGNARHSYRIDGDALPRNGSHISRQDVADFMIQQIDNPQWVGKGVYVSW